jgi:Ca2+-transporting ATPase
LPDFSLAFEGGAPRTMRKRPISKNEPIVDQEMKTIIFGVGIVRDLAILGLFIWMYKQGFEIFFLRTLFFAILGFKSLLTIYSLRSLSQPIWRINPFKNGYLLLATGTSFILLLLAIYIPFFQNLLDTMSLSLNSWLLVLGVGVMSVFMTEVVKYNFIIKKQ